MATKQEKMRGGIYTLLAEYGLKVKAMVDAGNLRGISQLIQDTQKDLLIHLDSQGVVLKVERDIPLCPNQPADDGFIENNFIKREAWIGCRNQFIKAGFTAVKPLVEDS